METKDLQAQLDAETLNFFNYILGKVFDVEVQGHVHSEEDWKVRDVLSYNPDFSSTKQKGKEVLIMNRNFIEYKVAEYPEQTERGFEWVVIFKRIYL